MNSISLESVIPNIFSDAGELNSGIWNVFMGFDKGQSCLIEAASGKGKSSLCSFIYGVRNDYSGRILFDGNDLKSFSSQQWDAIRRSQLSLLFQDLMLFGELTALENVQLKNNLTKTKTSFQVEEMFDRLGIADKINKKTAQLSWGQQQRVAVIRSLCQPFDFIMLDEPVSHLDDDNASNVALLVQEEASLKNAGIIVTSIGKHLPLNYTKRVAL